LVPFLADFFSKLDQNCCVLVVYYLFELRNRIDNQLAEFDKSFRGLETFISKFSLQKVAVETQKSGIVILLTDFM
jgi:hypothetical protein